MQCKEQAFSEKNKNIAVARLTQVKAEKYSEDSLEKCAYSPCKHSIRKKFCKAFWEELLHIGKAKSHCQSMEES